MRRETTRAQRIQRLLGEAAIVPDDDIQKRIRIALGWFIRIFRRWYHLRAAYGQQALHLVDTTSLMDTLNDALQASGEFKIHFEVSEKGDHPDNLFTEGDYDPVRDRVTIYLIHRYEFPSSLTNTYLMELLQVVKTYLEHEFIHREQHLRRARGLYFRQPRITRNPGPHFGFNAYADAQRDNNRLRAIAKEAGEEVDKGDLRHAAKSLTRRRMVTPDRTLIARDTTRARRDPLRRRGASEPRRRTGDNDYYGHPEEIMAFAAGFAQRALDSRRKYPEDFGAQAVDNAVYYYDLVKRHVGTDSPAFKLWLKYVYQYLSPTLSHDEIHQLLSKVIWGVPRYQGGFPQRS